MTNDGIVRASTIPKVLGADVSKRDYFLEGRKAPFAGDVHDALLLASILGGDPANPPRSSTSRLRCVAPTARSWA
jgi:diguanylate cyclase